jgi:hypothetical protein
VAIIDQWTAVLACSRGGFRLLLKLVGTLPGFVDTDTLSEYFRDVCTTRIKTAIANAIEQSGQSILEIATRLESLSATLKDALAGRRRGIRREPQAVQHPFNQCSPRR